jgi:hypothetical protein
MKITKEILTRLIKEEYKRIANEGWNSSKGIKKQTDIGGVNAGDTLIVFAGMTNQQEFEISYDEDTSYLYIMRDEEKIYIHPEGNNGVIGRSGTTDGTTKVDLLPGIPSGQEKGLVRVR